MTAPRPMRAEGERVWVADATDADVPAYVLANEQSRQRISEWNPVDPQGLPSLVQAASRHHRTLLVHATTPHGSHGIVGKVNVTSVVRGRADQGTLGYDAYDPYAGQGLFSEGLALAVGLAFAPEPAGMGLHRLEVNVQPGNVRSAMVVRQLGFRLEGHSPAYLRMPDRDGREAWRDHDRYALLATEWPSGPVPMRAGPRVVALVNGVPGSGKSSLAPDLAAALEVPLFSKAILKDHLWAVLSTAPTGAVVEGPFGVDERDDIVRGLSVAELDAVRVPETWSESSRTTAVAEQARPLAIGPVLRVDTTRPVGRRELERLALEVRAVCLGG